jgi:predicted phosphodiesterase
LERLARIEVPTYYLSGNGERAILEMAAGTRERERALDEWLVQAHGSGELATLSSWPRALTCTMRTGDRLRLCHGSPRSDIEVITPESPAERLREAFSGVDEATVVHGHTHIQYERRIADRQVIGPGSIGLPYTDGPFGAYWALISETVELIVTPYELSAAEELVEAAGYPSERFLDQLRSPISPAQLIADAEPRVFVD